MRLSALLASLLVVPLVDAAAQDLPLRPGQRVRVTVPSMGVSNHQTTFQRLAGDTLVFSSASYSVADVIRLDRYAGHKGHLWAGAGIGFLAGAGIGAIVVATKDNLDQCDPFSETECALIIVAIPAGAGLLLGGLTGALIKTDKWQEVPLDRWRVGIAPTPDGRVGLAVSLSF